MLTFESGSTKLSYLSAVFLFVCQVVEDGQLEIIPHFYTKTWKTWLSNIRWTLHTFVYFA